MNTLFFLFRGTFTYLIQYSFTVFFNLQILILCSYIHTCMCLYEPTGLPPPPHTLPLPGCMWRSEDSSLVSILFFPLVKSQDQVQDFWACAQAPPLSCLIDLCFVYIFFLILKVGVLVVCACIVASCTYLCVPTLVPVETLNFILKSLYKY